MTSYRIPPTNEELLAECDMDTYCSSGRGGQNVNRRETAVRLRHRPSGLVITCQRERNQYRNKQIAASQLRSRLHTINHKKRPRISTSMPRHVREKILDTKKRTSLKKEGRRKPRMDD